MSGTKQDDSFSYLSDTSSENVIEDQSKLNFTSIPHVKSESILTIPLDFDYDSSPERIVLEPFLLDSQTFIYN